MRHLSDKIADVDLSLSLGQIYVFGFNDESIRKYRNRSWYFVFSWVFHNGPSTNCEESQI